MDLQVDPVASIQEHHASFGIFMTAAAAFSVRPWGTNMPYDPTEDLLHSVAATAMGFSFAFGVLAIVLRRANHRSQLRWLDVAALAALVVLPVGRMLLTDVVGALQRGVFLVAYAWYARETLLCHTDSGQMPAMIQAHRLVLLSVISVRTRGCYRKCCSVGSLDGSRIIGKSSKKLRTRLIIQI